MSAVPRRLSAFLLLLVLAYCVYRARTQSFTVDEAWVFNSFVNQKLSVMGHTYDACNHVLHTLLMKLCRSMLGTGELALRVPSLLGALLYCVAVYKLTRLVLGGWTQLLAVALLTLHPLVLDFLIAARGYGLALGLFSLALYCAIVYHVRGFDVRWLRRAGVLAGLSIAANLVMLMPATALGWILLVLAWRSRMRGVWTVIDGYGGPAIVTAFLILIVPMLQARPEHFYFGETTLAGSVSSLVGALVKVPARWPGPSSEVWVPWVTYGVLPVCLALMAGGLSFAAYRYVSDPMTLFRLAPFVLVSGTLVFSAALVVVLHAVSGMKYPLGRTGLYFIPLFLLSALLGLRLLNGRWSRVRWFGHAAGAALAIVFVMQSDSRYFEDWAFDAGTGRLLRRMHEDFAQRVQPGQDPVRLGTSLFVDQTVRYYRVRRNMNWMNAPETEKLQAKEYDYYLLYGEDSSLVDKLQLAVVDRDGVSGEILARRAQ